jgi:hypothetical protein
MTFHVIAFFLYKKYMKEVGNRMNCEALWGEFEKLERTPEEIRGDELANFVMKEVCYPELDFKLKDVLEVIKEIPYQKLQFMFDEINYISTMEGQEDAFDRGDAYTTIMELNRNCAMENILSDLKSPKRRRLL